MSFALTRRMLLGGAAALVAAPAFAQARPLYRDPRAPVADRVRDVLGRMTLEEKVAQMRCLWFGKAGIQDAAGTFDPAKAAGALANGIGQVARPSDLAGTPLFQQGKLRSAAQTVAFVNAVQRFLVERTRLGIPALFHEETAHGLAAEDATVFPGPPALASSWDPDLVERVFTVAAREARARGATVGLSPVLDLARDPRFGRVEEFFGEDPFLDGALGVAAVRGLQGRQRPLGPDRVFATLKHFLHGAPEGGLNLAPFDASERTLRETWLPPFAAVIGEADPAILMPSYNEVQGVPAHASRDLLQRIGRELLGFKGAYFSDYNAITNLQSQHRMAANDADAAVLALGAGVDAELPDGKAFAALPALVRAGRVSEAAVDAAAARVLALKFEAGLFERPYANAKAAARPTDAALAREAAAKGIVLLRNDGLLPLDSAKPLRLAVIGPNAIDPVFGGYSGSNARAVGILAGLRAAAGRSMVIDHAEGVRITGNPPGGHASVAPIVPADPAANARLIAEAVEVARRADVVLLAVGDVPEITRESIFETAPGDRRTLELYGHQDRLIDAVLALGKPTVAALVNGRALAVETLATRANALLECWYMGQEGGHAFADVLFGLVNPGGKLPVSFPRSAGGLPVTYDRHPSATLRRYVEGGGDALFPFGHGLSFTAFTVSAPRLARARIRPDEQVEVTVDVTNTGTRRGDEVVQVYVRDELSSVPRPRLQLRAFCRVTLAPGETRAVRFTLKPDALALWDADMRWRVEPGAFAILVGSSSAALQGVALVVE